MGVPGLSGFVEKRGAFLVERRVRDTKLVIDGSSLCYQLYFSSAAADDFRRGGDYASFSSCARSFFAALRACRVSPCVLLDGGRGPADRKRRELARRARQRLETARELGRAGNGAAADRKRWGGGGALLLPLLARDAFVQALRALGVPFVQCFAEADRELAGLANRWGCPVLSLDSDFYVFEVAGGYLPLSHFQWRGVRGEEGGYVPARCFCAESFRGHFGHVGRGLLPLFAALNGNDYVDAAAFEAFFGGVRLPAKRGKESRLQGLLRWLSQFAEPAEAVDNVLKHVKKHLREEMRELLHAAMEDYAPSDVNLEDFFRDGRYECEDAKKAGVPAWVHDAFTRGELSPLVIDVFILRSTFLHVQVENMRRPSAHSTALPIRQVIYGLLLGAPPGAQAASPTKESNKPPVVCEFDRLQSTLKKTYIQAASLPADFCDGHFSLDKLIEVPMSCRRMLLLETLGVKMSSLEPFPSHLQLPVAVTCYWIRHSEPKVKLHQLKALLLMIVSGELHRITNDPDPTDLCTEDDRIAHNVFLEWKEKKLQNKDFDLDAAHGFCQWQCCLKMGLYLNQLLCTPLPEPDLSSRLYSGTLVHRLHQELKSTPSLENLFGLSPKMTQLYQVLLNMVES
ncbi:ASTE1 protein, partial [Piaya cayana]|nr:ASTE1 protein [Piaya cayana]